MPFQSKRFQTCTSFSALILSGALLAPTQGAAQTPDCSAPYREIPAGCEAVNAGEVAVIAVGANTEPSVPSQMGPAGFSLSINGVAVVSDPTVETLARKADVRLADADIRVQFDGLGRDPRLDLEIVGDSRSYISGETMRLQSALNYRAFVTRGEVRIIDRAAIGGPRTILTAPIDPNGQAAIVVPEGNDLVVVHRVYDAQGRYDETLPLSLSAPDQRPLADNVEDGSDNSGRRRIPIRGGAITVSGSGVFPGATVTVLGETIATDGSGGFVIQRILPAGDYGVGVNVNGVGQQTAIVRDVTIPNSQWTYVGTADFTVGIREVDGERANYNEGRIAGYAEGVMADGAHITVSADTGVDEIGNLFRRLDEKDPQSLLDRLDPNDLYPTYGDDSTIEDRTPTSGTVYLRYEKDGNYAQWGDFSAQLGGSDLVRNERSLYGFSGFWATQNQTSFGEPRASVTGYAAQPDQLPQRDTFAGTGGSVYFLERQDLTQDTETLSIQLRDPDTGRVIETTPLVAGRDYQINYVQGIVTLSQPLQSTAGDTFGSVDGADVVLVAQYEYTTTAGDLDGFAYGGRVDGWVTDKLRFGASGIYEDTGLADQTLAGADVLWRLSDNSFVKAEVAQSKGPGFGSTFSANGGLVFDNIAAASGTGDAVKAEARIALADMGLATEGHISAYFEDRSEGFSTLDRQVTDATGDEQLWGLSGTVEASERVTLSFGYDSYENAVDEHDKSAAAKVSVAVNEALTVTVGAEHEDKAIGTEFGTRTNALARVDYALNDVTTVYGFARHAVKSDGLETENRTGLGATYEIGDSWTTAAEISDGDLGVGGMLLANYKDASGNTVYLGYELNPNRTLGGQTLSGRDQGQVVVGGRRSVDDRLSVFGETTFDMFGDYKSLTRSYGLTFEPTNALSSTVAFELGNVTDDFDSDFERRAFSFGTSYATDDISASGRIELRDEKGVSSGTPLDSESILVSTNLSYKIDDSQRIVFSAQHANTNTGDSDVLDGEFSEVILGYALRPADNDRFNLLLRYRYLEDLYGQIVDDVDAERPRQRSHVLSVDGSYDINKNWTLGGKLGYRISETSEGETSPFVGNDAWLAVVNARYHLPLEWDVLLEARQLATVQSETQDFGFVAAAYKQVNQNVQLGAGYNFGNFSDDLTDLISDEKGAFVNLVASF